MRHKGKTLLVIVNKLFVFKSLLTIPSNVLPLHLKQTFQPIFRIFTEGEGDGIGCRLSSKMFFTLYSVLVISKGNVLVFIFDYNCGVKGQSGWRNMENWTKPE